MHRRNPTLKAAAISAFIGTAALTSPALHADPFDGFFAPGDNGEASIAPVESLFLTIYEAADGTSEGYARALTEAINYRVAAMQIFGDDWFKIDRALRNDFLEVFPSAIQDYLESLAITDFHIESITPTERDTEFDASGELVTDATQDPLPVTWTVRVRGPEARIIRAETADATLLLPEHARQQVADNPTDLEDIMGGLGY
ncbi:hypothetical protein ACN2MM_14320 [Alkalilimnicola ehrlichii MLHE-1]|uniref:Uncharacterized protein n=1 Tax=Alkalilimnicola ehrlichii (strain ATCC BAA-1101 / DSM 17681 / MLHE-1) TaxID=187272 RepID=Q0A542_ALKEH|nr:hypothetical protein [Alkalilimnicola ehrlichii]ABI58045.1 hypothetical protein Mlg_2705 [Alkalilimnicola ehrlichii MLHE-1]